MVAGASAPAECCSERHRKASMNAAMLKRTQSFGRTSAEVQVHVLSCQLVANRRACKPWLFCQPCRSLAPGL